MNLERLTFKELTSIAQYWRERIKAINLSTDRREFESGIKELTRINDEIRKRSKEIEELKIKEVKGNVKVIRWYYVAFAVVLILTFVYIIFKSW